MSLARVLIQRFAEQFRMPGKRYAFPFLAAIFLCISAAWIYNANSRVIDIRDVDEVHTVVYGTESLLRWPPPRVPTQRVGEFTRWFVRILYPFAIYYMNSYMGGEHYITGWEYPGGYYLRNHLNKGQDAPGASDVAGVPLDPEFPERGSMPDVFHTVDPNIQDYVFFQRVAFSILAILSFLLLLHRLYDRYGISAAAAYAGLILLGQIIFHQFAIFYSETSLFIVFNLAFYWLLSPRETRVIGALLLGVAAGAAMSTKLSGIIVAGPAFAHVAATACGRGVRGAADVVVFLLAALGCALALNAPFGSPDLVDQTLANVYHYKTGHLVTEEGGWRLFLWLVRDLGYATVALFLVSVAWLALRPSRRDVGLFALVAVIVALSLSLSGSAVYLSRNAAILYVAMSFIVAVGAGSYARSNRGARSGRVAVALCVAVFVVGVGDRALGVSSLSSVFFERNATRISRCDSVAVIGAPEKRLRRFVDGKDVAFFDRIRPPFNLSANPHMLEPPWYFEEYLAYDCIVALRRGQTRQITNFFAPQSHRLASRVGNWFFFDNGSSRGRPIVGL